MIRQDLTTRSDIQAVITYVQFAQRRERAPNSVALAAHEAAQRLSLPELENAKQQARGGI